VSIRWMLLAVPLSPPEGYSSLATTAVYVNHLGAEDVIAIGRERSNW